MRIFQKKNAVKYREQHYKSIIWSEQAIHTHATEPRKLHLQIEKKNQQ